MLNVKTKRYQLPQKIFIQIGFIAAIKKYWWGFPIPLVLLIFGFIWPSAMLWMVIACLTLMLLYALFWYIQFYGITQLPQGKTLFERYSYQFENERMMIMKNDREGMVIKWAQVQKAEIREQAFLLWISKVQFFYLPFSIFGSTNDVRWTEALLKRKKLLQ
jgi:hypothetical protein